VFELKAGLDKAAETLAKTVTTVDELAKNQPEMAKELKGFKVQLADGLKDLASNVNTSIAVLESKTAQVVAAAQASEDPLLKEKAYWLDQNRPVMPTNEAAAETRVIGIGFEAYYNPLFRPMFQCVYDVLDSKGKADAKLSIKTDGTVVASEDAAYKSFSVACHSPAYVSKKVTYHLSLTYEDAKGQRKIPFQGIKGRNTVMFDMVWTAVKFANYEVIVDVSGFDPKDQYVCEYVDDANSNIKKITDSKFLDNNKYKLNCGKMPTGFTIKLTTSRVKLTIKKKGTATAATYAGKTSTTIELPTCGNGAKDGSESDKDCGGLCPKCGPYKTCSKDGDCLNNKCNAKSKKCGGGPGTSSNEAGETCKQIKRDYPNAKNGRYYIRGVNNVLSPFKVYCWLADRDGGGWTLGLVNWHGSGVSSQAEIGNADGNVLGRRTYRYKLHDNKIRAVIGQKSNTASMFEIMQDANGICAHYTSWNREYNIFKDYTAKWHWTWHQSIEESSTKSDFHSYETRTFDGVNPVGDGKLNWRGRPRCGKSSNRGHNWQHNAGFFCHGDTYGSAAGFSSRPWGGSGCKQNLGRWSGYFHFFMSHRNTDTYVFVCNGAQHTSSSSMSHRWWFRSGKDMEK